MGRGLPGGSLLGRFRAACRRGPWRAVAARSHISFSLLPLPETGFSSRILITLQPFGGEVTFSFSHRLPMDLGWDPGVGSVSSLLEGFRFPTGKG